MKFIRINNEYLNIDYITKVIAIDRDGKKDINTKHWVLIIYDSNGEYTPYEFETEGLRSNILYQLEKFT